MKITKKRFYIEVKCLKASLNCFTGYTFDELNNWLVKNDYVELNEELRFGIGIYFVQENRKKDRYCYGICIHEFTLDRESLAILVHELHHVVKVQCEEKGINDMETKAYLQEYYFNEFLKKFKFN